MIMYEFECKRCGKVQNKWLHLDEELKEGCENEDCKAPPEELQKVLPAIRPHVSWSLWNVQK